IYSCSTEYDYTNDGGLIPMDHGTSSDAQ
ncbi:unnamed protein product, partial [Rotaria sp. Silwood2]